MANGRLLNKSIAIDDRLNTLSLEAMLMYLMSVPHLDRDGLIDGRPRVLWGAVAVLRSDLQDKTPGVIQEWIDAGLVMRYNSDRSPILWFVGFRKNQPRMVYQREQPSRFPPPPGYYRSKDDGLQPVEGDSNEVATNSRPSRDEVATNSRLGRAEHHNQDQENCDGDECIPTTSPIPVIENGGEMQEGGAARATSAGELLTIYSDDELRTAAHQLGSLLALHVDWTNWDRWLVKQSPETVVWLLEWIHYYRNLPDKALERIESLPAVIRSNLTAGGRPPFTGKQRRDLAVEIEAALYAVREV